MCEDKEYYSSLDLYYNQPQRGSKFDEKRYPKQIDWFDYLVLTTKVRSDDMTIFIQIVRTGTLWYTLVHFLRPVFPEKLTDSIIWY